MTLVEGAVATAASCPRRRAPRSRLHAGSAHCKGHAPAARCLAEAAPPVRGAHMGPRLRGDDARWEHIAYRDVTPAQAGARAPPREGRLETLAAWSSRGAARLGCSMADRYILGMCGRFTQKSDP